LKLIKQIYHFGTAKEFAIVNRYKFFFVNPFEQDKDDSDEEEDDSDRPYLFFINGQEIKTDIVACLKQVLVDTEKTVPIVYQPQAVFR
jgi:hypothetical protein